MTTNINGQFPIMRQLVDNRNVHDVYNIDSY